MGIGTTLNVQRRQLLRRHLRHQRQPTTCALVRLHRPGHLHPEGQQVHVRRQLRLNFLEASDTERWRTAKIENSLVSGGLYYQSTKSLKIVIEGNYARDGKD